MKTILITGGAGYIGSHAVKRFLQEGHTVVVFDNFSRGFRQPLEIVKKYGDLHIVEGDITTIEDIRNIFKNYTIDTVIHFAALCLVDESMRKPELYFKNNALGTLNLIEAMQEGNVKKIIFSSTCAVYGNADYLPIDEQHQTKPESPYGESKLMAENIIRWYGKLYQLQYVILRYFNVCGADIGGEIGDSKKPSELLVQNAVRGALGIEDFKLTCSKVDTEDGTPIRDYIDVEDLVEAHIEAYHYLGENKPSDTINIGNGKGWSVKEVLDTIKQELHTEFTVMTGRIRQGECQELYANIDKAKLLLRFSPKKNLTKSVQSLVKWYTNKPNGYEK